MGEFLVLSCFVFGVCVCVDTGDPTTDVDKGKSGGPSVIRGKRKQLKANAGVAWGKLISQRAAVGLLLLFNRMCVHLVIK